MVIDCIVSWSLSSSSLCFSSVVGCFFSSKDLLWRIGFNNRKLKAKELILCHIEIERHFIDLCIRYGSPGGTF